MVMEYMTELDGKYYPVIISDEPEALLAAKAAGRAIIGVDRDGNNWNLECAPYIIYEFEDATRELCGLVLRRHMGRPWTIGITDRLVIREFVKEDAKNIPREECGCDEAIFLSPQWMALYIEKQYKFYEYGTWAVTERDTGRLVGMAGVSNPKLPKDMEEILDKRLWLELGYHIFAPYRGKGYGAEAVAAVMDYAHEVLGARLCALIDAGNQASRELAKSMGMSCANWRDLPWSRITGTDIESMPKQLLYVESRQSQPDKGGP